MVPLATSAVRSWREMKTNGVGRNEEGGGREREGEGKGGPGGNDRAAGVQVEMEGEKKPGGSYLSQDGRGLLRSLVIKLLCRMF